jgi:threonine dehydratase
VVEPAGAVGVAALLDGKIENPGTTAVILSGGNIAENDANVTGLDHTRVGGSISMGDVSITVNLETKGHEHCEQVLSALRAEGFQPIVVH